MTQKGHPLDVIHGLSDEELFIAPEDFCDWELALTKAETDLRPKERGIVQIQYDALDAYSVFLYPNIVREFSDPDVLRRFLTPLVRDDRLLEMGFTLACNYRLANIDLNERITYRVPGAHKLVM